MRVPASSPTDIESPSTSYVVWYVLHPEKPLSCPWPNTAVGVVPSGTSTFIPSTTVHVGPSRSSGDTSADDPHPASASSSAATPIDTRARITPPPPLLGP